MLEIGGIYGGRALHAAIYRRKTRKTASEGRFLGKVGAGNRTEITTYFKKR